ncbi:hypothetical protein [Actinoplanes sp. NPDC026623]|uniref:hypothetical protein n=1 Tax=Actinoplanes sp. NPDC026623 TaxID=3155610 RepID=UPI0033E2D067
MIEDKPSPTQRDFHSRPFFAKGVGLRQRDIMGKRSRAIRAEMAQAGQNYTRAAATAAETPLGEGGVRSSGEAAVEHVRRLLRAQLATDDARYERLEELEQEGYRIVDGGQVGTDGWNILDWHTDEVIAEGDDGWDGYTAATKRLCPDGKWVHIDSVDDDLPLPQVSTPGVPPSLGQALDEWISQSDTSVEEIAQFVGWSVEKVRQHQ